MSTMSEFEVRAVEASVTFPLRRAVLGARLNEPKLEDMARPDDADPESGHFAAFDEAETIIGTGAVRRQTTPWLPHEIGYQIRGMAVTQEQRGRGVGAAILAAIIGHVEICGGGLLWCYARLGAQTLYKRGGFTTYGEPFVDGSSGEQIAMYRQVSPSRV